MEFLCDTYKLQDLYQLTNGLGGYSSMTSAFSAPRCDQGVLVSAEKAPNVRINLVHRLSEAIACGEETYWLSAQNFADETPAEDGDRHLKRCAFAYIPSWDYEVNGISVLRQCAMVQGENTVAVVYTIENTTAQACSLRVTPWFKFAPKEDALKEERNCFSGMVLSVMPLTGYS